MRTFKENYLHFMKSCMRPPYEKLKPLKSGFIENSNFENNRDPCLGELHLEELHLGDGQLLGEAWRFQPSDLDRAQNHVLRDQLPLNRKKERKYILRIKLQIKKYIH